MKLIYLQGEGWRRLRKEHSKVKVTEWNWNRNLANRKPRACPWYPAILCKYPKSQAQGCQDYNVWFPKGIMADNGLISRCLPISPLPPTPYSTGIQRSRSSWTHDPWPGDIFPLILSKRQDGAEVIAWASKSGECKQEPWSVWSWQVNALPLSLTHSFPKYFIEHLLCVRHCASCRGDS